MAANMLTPKLSKILYRAEKRKGVLSLSSVPIYILHIYVKRNLHTSKEAHKRNLLATTHGGDHTSKYLKSHKLAGFRMYIMGYHVNLYQVYIIYTHIYVYTYVYIMYTHIYEGVYMCAYWDTWVYVIMGR